MAESITAQTPYAGRTCYINWSVTVFSGLTFAGYKLSRRFDENGPSYETVYLGSNTSYVDKIPYGYKTVRYQVHSTYVNSVTTSGYSYTPILTIQTHPADLNVAPTVPSSITVPETIQSGQTLTVSWGASSDSNGNLSGYSLERNVNGAAWAVIYNGGTRSYANTITRNMDTLQYRVRAYDSYNAYSGYRTSPVVPVTHNQIPVISGENGDLGVKSEGFVYEYTVTDEENDDITIEERLDDTLLRSYPAQLGGTAAALVTGADWATLKQGSHTLSVNAIDPMSETAVRTMTFVKQVDRLSVSLEKPLQSEERPNRINVNVTAEVPLGATLTVETCNNGYDEEPVWEDATGASLAGRAHVFSNTLKLADDWGVNVRVTLLRGDAVGECYITGIGGNFD